MSATEFAALADARRIAPGKWQARCPAHDDRAPSLSIREGGDGRVLVHCFAGCSQTAILAQLGLAWSDLFAGPPPAPSQLAALPRQRKERESSDGQLRRELREATDAVRKWYALAHALIEKAMRNPDAEGSDEVAKLGHHALTKAREAEQKADELEARAAALRRQR